MRIAIMGSGKIGTATARGMSGKRHAVSLGARDPLAGKVAALANATGATGADPVAADIVILALPSGAAAAAVATLGDLRGQIVLYCRNPLGMVDGAWSLTTGHKWSGSEKVQSLLADAPVVQTLNQVGAEIMADTADLHARAVMFLAGNDPVARQAVAGLLVDHGFEPLDAGDITKALLLEPFGMLRITQAMARGKGRQWAFAGADRHGPQCA